jgi:hypothetical protein
MLAASANGLQALPMKYHCLHRRFTHPIDEDQPAASGPLAGHPGRSTRRPLRPARSRVGPKCSRGPTGCRCFEQHANGTRSGQNTAPEGALGLPSRPAQWGDFRSNSCRGARAAFGRGGAPLVDHTAGRTARAQMATSLSREQH